MKQIREFIGNLDLLIRYKTAFLCSRKIPANAVLKSYDWAIEQRENKNCIISGFHSQIEKDVFDYLQKGEQAIILVLPRGLKKRWESDINRLFETDHFLIITSFGKSVKRITKETSLIRNKLMIELADKIVVGYKEPGGNLDRLLAGVENDKEVEYLV